ncbi:hypothetical protein L202_03920 [Cryptococcus amylolentus CBS 6039]|uniref:Uncharacterized protein n=2 Tax=Cryptococcus amylolentus TaxID=104669 RepID=A0A1E3HPM0_9TREE|nr:hypothetical protein L202_03920 [Cryptococcus amylolentus CBS 6039]ODN78272.1 hypothetical protein L202_03920 [Cryptococcus amylolentus CBS 6039]ODO07126.1 hypothetical protein I350_04496 [Cryptococcus amylolentus CBS 6273]
MSQYTKQTWSRRGDYGFPANSPVQRSTYDPIVLSEVDLKVIGATPIEDGASTFLLSHLKYDPESQTISREVLTASKKDSEMTIDDHVKSLKATANLGDKLTLRLELGGFENGDTEVLLSREEEEFANLKLVLDADVFGGIQLAHPSNASRTEELLAWALELEEAQGSQSP